MDNMQLLIDLYNIPSHSNCEKEMTAAVKKLFLERGCKVTNKNGNLYITKGVSDTYPCIAAHLDEVHDKRGKYCAIYSPENDIIYGWSFTHNDFCGIGADDKNGIWVALRMVERLDYCKVALFRGEEIGCVGSQQAWMKFFKDCRFVLQVDRRNAGDLITDISGRMVSEEFMRDIQPIAEKYGYVETNGLMTDVETLCEKGVGISCVNMSCGYYNPHSDTEFTIWSELLNTADFVEKICTMMTDVYTYEYEPVFVTKGTMYGYGTLDCYFSDYYGTSWKTSSKSKKGKKNIVSTSYGSEYIDSVAMQLYEDMSYDQHFFDVDKKQRYDMDYADFMSYDFFEMAWKDAEDWLTSDYEYYGSKEAQL